MNNTYKNSNNVVINIEDVIKKYYDGWKLKDIAFNIKCSTAQIEKILHRETKRDRQHNYKYKINHEYFNSIDTEEKAYILGFLCADGSISKKGKSCLTISLQYGDYDILEKIKKAVQSESPIKSYTYNGRKYCNIAFYSERICDKLKENGCVCNKSSHLDWNNIKISSTLLSHFIRGYFDGDGCLSFWKHKGKYLKCHWNITSTTKFSMGLRNFILNKFGYSCYVSQRHIKGNNTKTIELSGNKQISTILKWMYNDATIFLNRKKEKYKRFIEIYEEKN